MGPVVWMACHNHGDDPTDETPAEEQIEQEDREPVRGVASGRNDRREEVEAHGGNGKHPEDVCRCRGNRHRGHHLTGGRVLRGKVPGSGARPFRANHPRRAALPDHPADVG